MQCSWIVQLITQPARIWTWTFNHSAILSAYVCSGDNLVIVFMIRETWVQVVIRKSLLELNDYKISLNQRHRIAIWKVKCILSYIDQRKQFFYCESKPCLKRYWFLIENFIHVCILIKLPPHSLIFNFFLIAPTLCPDSRCFLSLQIWVSTLSIILPPVKAQRSSWNRRRKD